ncbi:hypothetical protein OIE67_33550 [Nonomuraea fuscirosea]|uniref:hypothetical protein n=1 Tax=Nonomuraea fuscirosea TaxID=1291556 RepID=UPI002DDB5D60|nr:hypothetical protein [Nonomuraea fuscirosea]WSA48993.1 hypothetical protein OIE67_33550 [Nonomuraea fuscirosea]
MGEFVGIDPRWAQEVIRRMEAGKGVLGRTRPGLDAAIDEAGQDWAGHRGTTAMRRAWEFYHESQQDLKWRVDTLEQLVPVRERGMLTGTFPFGSETEAVPAAERTAHAILRALDQPATGADAAPETATGAEADEQAGGEEAGDVMERALAGAEGKTGDPAYAAALLATLGPDAFTRLLSDQAAPDTGGPAEDAVPADGGPVGGRVLAEAFASAERTGRLGDAWYELVDSAPAGVLTNLVTLASQSGAMLNRVATGLLGRPPAAGWSPRALIQAYERDPLAFQQLLAEHRDEARVLLDAAADDPGCAEPLASAVHEALKPGAGVDGLRERAWRTVVRGLGATLEIEDR